jgi:hypothetical protein
VSRGAGLALLLLAASVSPALAGDVGRYKFSCRTDPGTFVLDSETGRVWRYDRVDDAWYLYDLEALVGKNARAGRAERPAEGESAPREAPER